MAPHSTTASVQSGCGASESAPECRPDGTLAERIALFQQHARQYFGQTDPARVVQVSAFLVTDNVIVDLFCRYLPALRPTLVSVDTLHVFPETLAVADAVASRYGMHVRMYKPANCETQADFVRLYGTPDTMSHEDFDRISKIEPLQRAFEETHKLISITGRRADQGNARTELSVWEPERATFNPLAGWSWRDVCDYAILHRVPCNALHRRLVVSSAPVPAAQRSWSAIRGFQQVELAMPFFAYEPDWLRGHGPHVYVWKSFGDVHTSVPVELHESERAGRFIGRSQTECGIHTRISNKGDPHGGRLINLLVPEADSPTDGAQHTLELTERQVCDLECLANGAFSPLRGFMDCETYTSVVERMRLPEGQLWGLPVTLDTDRDDIHVDDFVLLTHAPTGARGVLKVRSKWTPDRRHEARRVYGTDDEEHPAVQHLLHEKRRYNIGGPLWVTRMPQRDWVRCKTPAEVRAESTPGRSLVAFQSRNPIHRAHAAMFLRVAQQHQADVLVHPVVGPTKDDDVPATVRKASYDALARRLTNVRFEYLPYNMMVGGPREALQHMIIRKNYGCTGMIVGRDHAGCKNKAGVDFYGAYDAQELLRPLQRELATDMIDFTAMVYVRESDSYMTIDEAQALGYEPLSISGTKFRTMLRNGDAIPAWFAFPEVVDAMRPWAVSEQA